MIIENFDDFYDHYQGFSAYVAFCITEDYELSKDNLNEKLNSGFGPNARVNSI